MRTFVGLEIPEATRDLLSGEFLESRPLLTDARWIPPANWHLTLAFLGPTEDMQLPELNRLLAPVFGSFRRFDLVLSGFGLFPPRGRAKVAWAGLERSRTLSELRDAVVRECRLLGFEIDDKPFFAHVTVARARRPWRRGVRKAWLEAVECRRDVLFEPLRGCLVESILGSDGARYRMVQSYPIGR